MNAFLLPLLVFFTVWWSLLPDQVIMTVENLLDPVCIKEGIHQTLDPLTVTPENNDEFKRLERNSALKEPKYRSAAPFILGAIALLILLVQVKKIGE